MRYVGLEDVVLVHSRGAVLGPDLLEIVRIVTAGTVQTALFEHLLEVLRYGVCYGVHQFEVVHCGLLGGNDDDYDIIDKHKYDNHVNKSIEYIYCLRSNL